MIAYVDASVLLRMTLGQPNALPEWPTVERGVASALVRAESLRTLDRLRLSARLSDAEIASRRAAVLALIDTFDIVQIDAIVLDRASQPMPTELGTLDAIHLATALLWREMTDADLVMATHDAALALGAVPTASRSSVSRGPDGHDAIGIARPLAAQRRPAHGGVPRGHARRSWRDCPSARSRGRRRWTSGP